MCALKQTDHNDWDQHLSTLAWLVFLGIHCSRSPNEREYFLERLVTCVKNLRLMRKSQLREILLGFPYLDRVYEDALNRVWDELERLQKEIPTEGVGEVPNDSR